MSGLDKSMDHWHRHRPFVYHMAYEENREGIRRHGLLSTLALLDLFEIHGQRRADIFSKHRPQKVLIEHPVHGTAIIRDQKPMNPKVLGRHIVGMSVAQWFEKLNRHVFFWVKRKRLDGMIGCKEYHSLRTIVFKVRTRDLLKAHPDALVTTINTGNTKMMPVDRGEATFTPVREFRKGISAAAELVVPDAVRDLMACVESITVEQNGAVVQHIRPAAF